MCSKFSMSKHDNNIKHMAEEAQSSAYHNSIGLLGVVNGATQGLGRALETVLGF